MNYPYSQLLGLVFPVYLVIAAGFAIRRLRWLTTEADASLTRVTVNLLAPALILDSLIGNPALREPSNLILPPLIGFFSTALGYAIGLGIAPLVGIRDPLKARAFAFATGLCNYGFIPIPLTMELFDFETLGVLFSHNLGVEIALWTVGIFILTRATGKSRFSGLLNAPVIAVALGLILNLAGGAEWLPRWLLKAVEMAGLSAVPMALILTGAILADWIPRRPQSWPKPAVPLAAILVRLAILPVLILTAAIVLPCSRELERVLVLQAAMPSAVFPIVLTQHYGGDTRTALWTVVSTSVVGLLTIPWWIRFGLHFIGGE